MISQLHRQFLDEVSAEFKSGLAARLSRIDRLWQALALDPVAEKDIVDLRRELHSLAGSAGTFGLPALGETARAAEDELDSFAGNGGVPLEKKRATLKHLLEALRRAIERA